MKVLLDSSRWIEFFTSGSLADRYATYLGPRYQLITPTIVLYEVYKKIKQERGEETALLFAGRLNKTQVIQLTVSIAYLAADVSLRHGLGWRMRLFTRQPRTREPRSSQATRI